MKVGIGSSKQKDTQKALQEAYRGALQKLGSLKAEFVVLTYTYDHALDSDLFSAILQRQFKGIPHIGASTWSAWDSQELTNGDAAIFVMAFKDMPVEPKFLRIHSIKEKAELWQSEVIRNLEDLDVKGDSSLMMFGDSLHFVPGNGFAKISEAFPKLLTFGMGTSYGIPQCTVAINGALHSNTLVGVYFENYSPWVGLIQNVRPEEERITINRMSENLLIEIDEKPAFYRLCEHLMNVDDLPMMSQDDFRKHMGNLFIVEKDGSQKLHEKVVGEAWRIVSLLGSEMTTGMVAVAEALDFQRSQFLGQRKAAYAEASHAENIFKQLKEKCPKPAAVLCFCSNSHIRDANRSVSDRDLLMQNFSDVPLLGISSNGEFLREANTHSTMIAVFPS